MTRQLFLDCDGVLADFDAGARDVLGMSSRAFEDRHGKREFWKRIARAPAFYADLPLMPDRPIEFGVWDFCLICEKCARKCPSKSIVFGPPSAEPHNISNRGGVNTWHINAETCLQFWADNGCDCSNCIRSCPFNKPSGI